MTQLPASIEQHLQDSGFSATEILILKKLLNGESVTLRELAAKTGKSTGVLDQATKKLLEKNILKKDTINDTPKYALVSLTAIQEWVEEDVLKQHAALKRKKENFDAFLSTVKHQKGRPEMEYFEGTDGMEKAFEKLLALGKKEWLHFQPAVQKEEEDPIAPYRVQLFRRRRNSKLFLRALTPSTPLGKRYRSRDAFEYRETQLTDPASFPVNFEQYIVGDTIACIDTKELKASFIHYPELAEGQRKLFEVLWCSAKKASGEKCTEGKGGIVHEASIETAALSGLREFFLSKKSVVTLALFGVLAGVMTWGLYVNNFHVQKERLADKAVAIASTAALQIDGDALDRVYQEKSMQTEDYQNIFEQLNSIRDKNPGLVYIYTLKPNEDPTKFEWLVDADTNYDTPPFTDTHQDGALTEEDENVYPGLLFDASDIEELQDADFTDPIRTNEFNADKWGTFMSGYAPIFNSKGEVAALLGVDYWAYDVQELTLQAFEPFYWFICIFALFVLVRFFAFHRPLAKDLWELSKNRRALLLLSLSFFMAVILTITLHMNANHINSQRIRDRVKAIAATGAPLISYKDVNQIHSFEDTSKDEYDSLIRALNKIRSNNKGIEYAYIMRKTDNPHNFSFVADADSFEFNNRVDLNEDGLINDQVPPGQLWFDDDPDNSAIHKAFRTKKPTADPDLSYDEWGVWISGHAPILDQEGNPVAVLGVDMLASSVDELTKESFSHLKVFLAMFSATLLISLVLNIVSSIFKKYK